MLGWKKHPAIMLLPRFALRGKDYRARRSHSFALKKAIIGSNLSLSAGVTDSSIDFAAQGFT
jgi:hypothetical protein